MAEPHTGKITFLFTDVEGSTSLWEKMPKAMSEALSRHDEILRTVIEDHNGHVFKTVGDAFHATFSAASDALEAALEAQRALLNETWDLTGPLRVRMALHTGAAEERDGDYFGPSLNRVARLLSAGHGGQILLSLATREMVRDRLPDESGLRDLGERRLKDLSSPEHVFQITASGLRSEFPPLKTLDIRRNNLPAQPTPLVGRERELEEILALVRSPDVRLLTLIGPGGTGKTRLGLQAAAELTDEFEDGVFFVALAAIADPTLVAPAITRTLGLTESGNQPQEELLEGYLRERQVLLMLDITIRAADTLSRPTITDQVTWWYRIDLSELDRVEVFRRTYGSSERGFGLGRQRLWIDEPARAQVGEDEPPHAGSLGCLSCIGRR